MSKRRLYGPVVAFAVGVLSLGFVLGYGVRGRELREVLGGVDHVALWGVRDQLAFGASKDCEAVGWVLGSRLLVEWPQVAKGTRAALGRSVVKVPR